MVTAILPSMTYEPPEQRPSPPEPQSASRPANGTNHNITPSISSELTITPARYHDEDEDAKPQDTAKASSTSQLAGLVGMFTGMGALIALFAFLPLPTHFENVGQSPSDAITHSFYVVGTIAFVVSALCFIGLRNLPGETHKSVRHQFRPPSSKVSDALGGDETLSISYVDLVLASIKLAGQDSRIFLGYLGGFVARASSVAISLFIPLFCNAYFISNGSCTGSPPHESLPGLKDSCSRAYILASILSGTSQLVALICAPIFGFAGARANDRFNLPLLGASVTGVIGYSAFALIKSPDFKDEDGSGAVFFIVALLGISQIGAIVCSLSLLGRGINGGVEEIRYDHVRYTDATDEENEDDNSHLLSPSRSRPANSRAGANQNGDVEEAAPLLNDSTTENGGAFEDAPLAAPILRSHLKGTIAGLYSLFGGAAILILTKLGGWLFDAAGKGAPFWLMAVFNAVLLVGTVGVGLKSFSRIKLH